MDFNGQMQLAESNFRAVRIWLDNKFLSEHEKLALVERLAEGLGRYKELVNAVCDVKTGSGNRTVEKVKSLNAWAESLNAFARNSP